MPPEDSKEKTVDAQALAPVSAAVPVPAPPERHGTAAMLELLRALPDTPGRDQFVQAIVEAGIAHFTFDLDQRMARAYALSQKFDDLRAPNVEQAQAIALTKIMLARAWGMNQADAIRHIFFINGKPSVENEIVAGKLQQAGWSWEPEYQYGELPDSQGKVSRACTGCTLWLRKQDPLSRAWYPLKDRHGNDVSVSFTKVDADRAMVYADGKMRPLSEKMQYMSWPSDMYYWRCISRVKKLYAPHVLRGGMTREEAYDAIPADSRAEMLPPDGMRHEASEPPPNASLRDRVMSQSTFLPPEDK
jgi:hypothetical protein